MQTPSVFSTPANSQSRIFTHFLRFLCRSTRERFPACSFFHIFCFRWLDSHCLFSLFILIVLFCLFWIVFSATGFSLFILGSKKSWSSVQLQESTKKSASQPIEQKGSTTPRLLRNFLRREWYLTENSISLLFQEC